MVIIDATLPIWCEALGGAEGEAGVPVAGAAAVSIDNDMSSIVDIELNCAETLGN